VAKRICHGRGTPSTSGKTRTALDLTEDPPRSVGDLLQHDICRSGALSGVTF